MVGLVISCDCASVLALLYLYLLWMCVQIQAQGRSQREQANGRGETTYYRETSPLSSDAASEHVGSLSAKSQHKRNGSLSIES